MTVHRQNDRVQGLKAEIAEAENSLRRLAHAVAVGALDSEAARAETMDLREKRERAQKRLEALVSGSQVGNQLAAAIGRVERDFAVLLAEVDRGKVRELARLVLKKFSVVASGSSRNRNGQVVSYEFNPEFQEVWLTHSERCGGAGGT